MTSATTRPDFADWLSPMLVKELRQGMRSRIFMAAFYLTQLLMILSVIFNLTATSGEATGDLATFLNGLFWFMVSVPLLFVMPIRGFGALHGEIKDRTLELVFLTRLTSWRIAFGKWTALMVQTLLLVCAVLPYVLLRYFLGGVNVIDDLQSLLFLFITSAALTAATIAMSPYESRLLRALFVIGLIFAFNMVIGLLISWMAADVLGASSRSSTSTSLVYLGLAAFIPTFIVLALEIAASKIAPAAENHAIRKRLIGLCFLVAAFVLTALGAEASSTYNTAFFFLAIVVIDALSEPLEFTATIYQPFQKLGFVGKFLSLFFTPGWVSGAWYVILASALSGLMLVTQSARFADDQILLRLSYLGWLVFPAAIIRMLMPRTQHFLGFYIGIQFLFAAITFLVSIVTGISNEPTNVWLSIFPNSTFYLAAFGLIKPEQLTGVLAATLTVTGASIVILLARTVGPLRDIRNRLTQNSAR